MCRWLAYSGGPIFLEEVIVKQERSLLDQSLHSRLGATTTNGDGFGIGWYGKRDRPGIYRSMLPAWNDPNLRSLSEQIESRLFLAHVRATTGTPVQLSNCHPFSYENWIFVHNGEVREFEKVKRDLIMLIDPHLFPFVKGSTDSEVMFFLALSFGMREDVKKGVSKMVKTIETIGSSHGIANPIQMTLGISDGESIYGFRYSSEGQSRSLFISEEIEALEDIAPRAKSFTRNSRALVSEPLGSIKEAWIPIKESRYVKIHQGEVIIENFAPEG